MHMIAESGMHMIAVCSTMHHRCTAQGPNCFVAICLHLDAKEIAAVKSEVFNEQNLTTCVRSFCELCTGTTGDVCVAVRPGAKPYKYICISAIDDSPRTTKAPYAVTCNASLPSACEASTTCRINGQNQWAESMGRIKGQDGQQG